MPVIKLECSIFPTSGKSNFNVPEISSLKYPEIALKPICIDITQMTEFHNGL